MKLYLPEKMRSAFGFCCLSLSRLAGEFFFSVEFQWTHVNFISLSNGLTDRIET